MNKLPLAASIALLSACSSFTGVFEDPPPTLADLEPATLPAGKETLPGVGLEEMAQIYRDVLAGQRDPEVRLQVSHRLTDLDMMHAEEQLASTDSLNNDDFDTVISAYESLLRDYPDYAHRDRVLYQLSKAYALSGRSDQSLAVLERLATTAPASPYLPEAWFRQAERRFVDKQYAQAQALYARVIAYGEDTPYFTRALYMQGWSYFKQDQYDAAIAAFTTSLDQVLPQEVAVQNLPRAEQELVHDSLRVMAIVFSRQQGADSIASAYEQLGERHWEYMLYDALGELYLSQERYADSALAYQVYTQRWPQSKRAHRFQLRVIDAYEAGGFDELIVTAKQDYVAAFSVGGDYWSHSKRQARQAIEEHLKTFIPELARHHHALAQELGKTPPENDSARQQRKQLERKRQANMLYARAAHYYQLYLHSFPNDAATPQLAFLLAESLYEARDYLAAIDAYEQVAYHYGDPANAADAAYTAILAYDKLAGREYSDLPDLWRNRIDSELRFQANFPSDERAAGVLGHAATALMELEDYSAAVAAATNLVTLAPQPDASLLIPAWLVIGHSQFALRHYPSAEQAYRHGLQLLADNEARRKENSEIYCVRRPNQVPQPNESKDCDFGIVRVPKLARTSASDPLVDRMLRNLIAG